MLAYDRPRSDRVKGFLNFYQTWSLCSALLVILVLAVVRFAARGYFDTFMTTPQTGGLFFVLAFGMIVVWRGKLLRDYLRLTSEPTPGAPEPTLDELIS